MDISDIFYTSDEALCPNENFYNCQKSLKSLMLLTPSHKILSLSLKSKLLKDFVFLNIKRYFFPNTLWYLLSYLEPYLALWSAVSWLKIQGGTFKTIQSRIKQKVMSKGRGKKVFSKSFLLYFGSFRSFISKYIGRLSTSWFCQIVNVQLFCQPCLIGLTGQMKPIWNTLCRIWILLKKLLAQRDLLGFFVITCTFLKVCQKEICSKSFLQSTFAR